MYLLQTYQRIDVKMREMKSWYLWNFNFLYSLFLDINVKESLLSIGLCEIKILIWIENWIQEIKALLTPLKLGFIMLNRYKKNYMPTHIFQFFTRSFYIIKNFHKEGYESNIFGAILNLYMMEWKDMKSIFVYLIWI